MNQLNISGRLTRDPEYTEEGTPRVNFTVAVDRRGRKADGDKTDFFRCVAWYETATNIAEYFCKGKPIIITGRMENDPYTDKDGRLRDSWSLKVERWEFTLNDKAAGGTSAKAPAKAKETDTGDTFRKAEEDIPF